MNKPFVNMGPGHFEKLCGLLDCSAPVEVYKNLHKNCWSIRQRGRVVAHTRYVCLKNCSFVVRPAGRAKVLAEKKKNVHAFVKGYLVDPRLIPEDGFESVTYNPYEKPFFYKIKNKRIVRQAGFVDMLIGFPSPVMVHE